MAKKIKVVFELEPEDVKNLLEFGSKGPKKISRDELKKMTEAGVVRASDYLADDEAAAVTGIFGKIIGKVAKAGTKLVGTVVGKLKDDGTRKEVGNKANQALTGATVGHDLTSIITMGFEDDPSRDRPKT